MSNLPPCTTLQEEIADICFTRGTYPSGWPHHDSCPCCGSTSISYSFKKYKIAHWLCRTCRFVFVNPYPDTAIIEALYNSAYYSAVRRLIEIPKARKGSEDASQSLPSRIYSDIISYITKQKQGGVWLDVGGGIGNFLSTVRSTNPKFDLFLNEMNNESRAFAQDYYGLNVLSEPPETLARQGFHCDIITMLSVLEHISHPLEFIMRYSSLLNPHGILVINIPRFSSLNRLFSKGASSNVVPPYHLSFFNEKNIQTLFARTRCFQSVEWWQCGPKAFSLVDIMHVGEYFDVEIPQQESDAPKCTQIRSYATIQNIAIDYLAKYDNLLSGFITRMDGNLFLNIAATKGTGY